MLLKTQEKLNETYQRQFDEELLKRERAQEEADTRQKEADTRQKESYKRQKEEHDVRMYNDIIKQWYTKIAAVLGHKDITEPTREINEKIKKLLVFFDKSFDLNGISYSPILFYPFIERQMDQRERLDGVPATGGGGRSTEVESSTEGISNTGSGRRRSHRGNRRSRSGNRRSRSGNRRSRSGNRRSRRIKLN